MDRKCHIKNDYLNAVIEKMIDADGIILGSPVYFADISTELKAKHPMVENTDIWAIHRGYISVTPLHFDITHHSVIKDIGTGFKGFTEDFDG